ncbi:GNAT family N-acetyltransferase [Aquimarina longa]|uniref:GNAT family N-acetyltransferase n=1 Tax=Aquimarina longa TaxID=1080221 RepID=UPI000781007C|nr:GNAT family N-acetyltransferase [Aquimarina longa]
MEYTPSTHQTKSGHTLIIREATPEDAEQLVALKLQYLKNTDTIPLFDYEYPNTVEDETNLIIKMHQQTNCLLLVAENNGNLVGNIDLTGSWRKKMQHTAMVGMGIHTEWQHQGIGTLLLQNVLAWTKWTQIIKTIWLEVYETNITGIALYKKMGFIPSGCIHNFFLEKEKYIDKITMSKTFL